MSKKYYPSGYQTITIDWDNDIEDDVLKKETEDCKSLYKICEKLAENSEEVVKPILMLIKHGGASMTGFVTVNSSYFKLATSVVDDHGAYSSIMQHSFDITTEDEKIVIKCSYLEL